MPVGDGSSAVLLGCSGEVHWQVATARERVGEIHRWLIVDHEVVFRFPAGRYSHRVSDSGRGSGSDKFQHWGSNRYRQVIMIDGLTQHNRRIVVNRVVNRYIGRGR